MRLLGRGQRGTRRRQGLGCRGQALLVVGRRQRGQCTIQASQRRAQLSGLLLRLPRDCCSRRGDLLALGPFFGRLGTAAARSVRAHRGQFLFDVGQHRSRLLARLRFRGQHCQPPARFRAITSRGSAQTSACGAPARTWCCWLAAARSDLAIASSRANRAICAFALGMRARASRASPNSLHWPCMSVPAHGTSPVSPKRWASSSAFSAALPASRSMPANSCSASRSAAWHCVSALVCSRHARVSAAAMRQYSLGQWQT